MKRMETHNEIHIFFDRGVWCRRKGFSRKRIDEVLDFQALAAIEALATDNDLDLGKFRHLQKTYPDHIIYDREGNRLGSIGSLV